LKRIVAPFILRRTKQEVEKELPPLVIENWYCSMSNEQEKRYEMEKSAVRNEILQKIETDTSPAVTVAVLRALTRLRQTANHPVLVDPEYTGESGKFEEVIRNMDILREEGHKALIFSSFVKHLNLFVRRFEQDGIPFSILTGASLQRDQIIQQFRNDPGSRFS
jgi:SNF2 family DNA or RNA helicase